MRQFDLKRRIVCEGQNDIYLFSAFFSYLGVEFPPRADEASSVDQVMDKVETVIDSSDLLRLGIWIDANDKPSSRWDRVKNRLLKLDKDASIPNTYSAADEYKVRGKILTTFIASTTTRKGYTESLLLESVTLDAECRQIADFIESIGVPKGDKSFDKRVLKCYLSILGNPDAHLAGCIPKLFDPTKGQLPNALAWLRSIADA